MDKSIKDKWFYFPIIIFSILFIKELIQYSWIINYFPIHVSADIITYVFRLYQLVNYGFHQFVPFVFGNGFISFTGYPPGWAFFTLPFYYLTKQYFLASYLSLIAIFILLFIAFYLIGKLNKFSLTKTIAFYILFLANPLMLDSIFHIGRSSEIFSWMIFSIFFLIILWYKDNPKDYKFLILTLAYSILLLSHIYQFILGSILMFSLFLIDNNKGRIKIIISGIITLIITSFWWIPFSKALKLYPSQWTTGIELKTLESLISYNSIGILVFLVCFYFYFKSNPSKKEILFYLPTFILSGLIILRLILFVPVLNELPINLYTSYFIFLGIFLFLKTEEFKPIIRKIIPVILILLPIVCTIFFLIQYDNSSLNYKIPYEYTQTDKEIISIFDYVDGRMFVVAEQKRSNIYAIYATIMKDKKITAIDVPWDANNKTIIDETFRLFEDVKSKDCKNLSKHASDLLTTEFVSYEDNCKFLKDCGFEFKKQIGNACLYENKFTNSKVI